MQRDLVKNKPTMVLLSLAASAMLGSVGCSDSSTNGDAPMGAGGSTLAGTGGGTGGSAATGAGANSVPLAGGGGMGSGGATGTGGTGPVAATGSSGATNSGGAPGPGGVAGSSAGGTGSGATGSGGAASSGTGGTGAVAGSSGSPGVPVEVDTTPTGPLLPPNGAVDTCADVTLGIVLAGTPVLKGSGKVQLLDDSGKVVETFSSADPVKRTVAGEEYNINPIQVVGHNVYFLPSHPLQYGKSYSVKVDDGMIGDDQGNSFSVSDGAWKFSVRAAKPPTASAYTLASDGAGDYCTVQGALDSIPENNAPKVTLNINNGAYPGLVVVEKSNVTFQGSNRFKTILANRNSALMSIDNGKSSRMAYRLKASDLTFDSLSIWNTYPQEAKEPETRMAEAVTAEKEAKRIFMNQVEIKSFQDTVMVDEGSQVYLKDSRIWGDIDIFWGGGALYCENCEITTAGDGHNLTNSRTQAGSNGLAFVNCKLTRTDETIVNTTLGRRLGFQDGNVAYINCQMDAHITGWKNTSMRDWERGNTSLVDNSPLMFAGEQLPAGSAKLELTASAQSWLGWSPTE